VTGESLHAAWLVDLDGTLYAQKPVQFAMGAEVALLGWSALAILRRFRREQEDLRKLELEGDPFMLQVERTALALGAPHARVEAEVRNWMIERPGKWMSLFRRRRLLEEIRAYRAAGGRTALVSDYPARRKLEALGASALFDVVVASGEPDGPLRLKPHPSGVLRAATALGVDPSRCLVIGDRTDADGAAAKSAGMAFRLVG
jgi:HAD superfamily hydrolase (TIGR01549 family)